MTQHDQQLIEQARNSRWEDIDETKAETPEGRKEIHRIMMSGYHREEYKAFGVC